MEAGENHHGNSINNEVDAGDFFMRIEAEEDERSRKEKEEFRQERRQLSASLKLKIKEYIPAELQKQSDRNRTTCIYRAPDSLVSDGNGDKRNNPDFHPRIVSIGPYHREEKELQKMEKHKWKYLSSLLQRSRVKMNKFVKAVMKLEKSARSCYADQSFNTFLHREQFVEMLLLDGCFLVELLCKFSLVIEIEEDDPIFTKPWRVPLVKKDLLMLENQLPFSILELIFELSSIGKYNEPRSLARLIHLFLDRAMLKPMKVINVHPDDPKHLLDFIRSSLLPGENTYRRDLDFGPFSRLLPTRRPHLRLPCGALVGDVSDTDHEMIPITEVYQLGLGSPQAVVQDKKWGDLIPCAEALRAVGIKFKAAKGGSCKLLSFKHRVMEIPSIAIDHGTASFLLNCIAFEQCCYYGYKPFSDYAMLMDLLINTPRDVAILCDKKIIKNYYGTEDQVAQFFNDFGKVIAHADIKKGHLYRELEKINQHYNNNWNEFRTSFIDTYFKSVWVFLSAIAAFILLVLTVVQTVFAILGYFRPPPA